LPKPSPAFGFNAPCGFGILHGVVQAIPHGSGGGGRTIQLAVINILANVIPTFRILF
jgi:hypothetical protein